MFTEPQSVNNLSAVSTSLPRTSFGTNLGVFGAPASDQILTVSHAYGKRNRRIARLDYAKTAADIFVPSTNVRQNLQVYLVVNEPSTGFNATERLNGVAALTSWLTASTNANLIKFLGGES